MMKVLPVICTALAFGESDKKEMPSAAQNISKNNKFDEQCRSMKYDSVKVILIFLEFS